MAAVVTYTEGIRDEPSDHRLYSNRALCYAALQDWDKSKKDALETTKLRPEFMKGWFTLCRSYLMNNEAHVASKEMDKAMKNCQNHPDLVKLQEEIRLALGDRDQRLNKVPNHRLNISPACTPPTPRRPVNPLVRAGPQWGVDLEQTAQFGGLDATANFGLRGNVTPPFRVNPPAHSNLSRGVITWSACR